MGPSKQQVALVSFDIGTIVVGLFFGVDALLLKLAQWEVSCTKPWLLGALLLLRPAFLGLNTANTLLLAMLAWDRRDGIQRPIIYRRLVNHNRRAAKMIIASLAFGG